MDFDVREASLQICGGMGALNKDETVIYDPGRLIPISIEACNNVLSRLAKLQTGSFLSSSTRQAVSRMNYVREIFPDLRERNSEKEWRDSDPNFADMQSEVWHFNWLDPGSYSNSCLSGEHG